jgi:hypothetical protein
MKEKERKRRKKKATGTSRSKSKIGDVGAGCENPDGAALAV